MCDAHLGEVPAERLIARVLVARLDRVEIRGERHLGVDDDDALGRQAHDHVGAQPAALAVHRLLLDEVAERRHAGELGDAAERDLAPASADVRRAQRLHQLVRLGAQRLMGDGDVAQLLADLAQIALAPLLEAARFLLVAVERLLQRPDQRLDGEAPRLEIVGRVGAQRLELLVGELQEVALRAGQRVGGERLERVGEPLARLVDEAPLVLDAPLGGDVARLGLDAGAIAGGGALAQRGGLRVQRLHAQPQLVGAAHGGRRAGPADRPGDDRAERQAGEEREQERRSGDRHGRAPSIAGRAALSVRRTAESRAVPTRRRLRRSGLTRARTLRRCGCSAVCSCDPRT